MRECSNRALNRWIDDRSNREFGKEIGNRLNQEFNRWIDDHSNREFGREMGNRSN